MGSYDPRHPDLGWQPSIPEPFWIRKRVGWFRRRWRPACYWCEIVFDDEDGWGSHYLRDHNTSGE